MTDINNGPGNRAGGGAQSTARTGAAGAGDALPGGTSVINAEVSIIGKLISEGAVQVDGSVDGAVACRSLRVGVDGHIRGEVACDEVVVDGRVDGDIDARQVYLGASAKVLGDIAHEALDILPGAYFEGRVLRRDKKPEAAARGGSSA